jgi:hypothetical protein
MLIARLDSLIQALQRFSYVHLLFAQGYEQLTVHGPASPTG